MHRLRRSSRVLRTRRATLIVAVALIAVAATAMVASAVTLTPKSGHNLVAVGPISGENGFPESYSTTPAPGWSSAWTRPRSDAPRQRRCPIRMRRCPFLTTIPTRRSTRSPAPG